MTNGTPHNSQRWLRFEDVEGRVLEDNVLSDVLPQVGQLIPIGGAHCEVMEQWTDRALVAAGGPEVTVFTVKPLPQPAPESYLG